MSVIFFDGFDYYNSFGPGGRKWDQGSSGFTGGPGRFGGQYLGTGNANYRGQGTQMTFTNPDTTLHNVDTIITGWAMNIGGYTGAFGNPEMPSHPLFEFMDLATAQCSLWINATTQYLEIRTGDGSTNNVVLSTTFAPPLTLWFYLEMKLTVGTSGSIELKVNGTSIGTASGVNLQVSGNPYCNRIAFYSYNNYSGGVQAGAWVVDDLYVVDATDGMGSVDYLGEVRIQTKYPDANGYETDFLRSSGLVNANNVLNIPMPFADTTLFNYSGTVGAKDLYSIGNFTVSGTIFAVQESISFKKDDVGNRQVAPILRTAATNYIGDHIEGSEPHSLWHSCFSSYTYAGQIWETNPNTGLDWELIDLNLTEFGMKVVS